jgi:hypothetical protein
MGEPDITQPSELAEPEPVEPEQAEFNYSAPEPLPADWHPGYGQRPNIVPAVAGRLEPLETVEGLGIGPRDPYPSKEN